MKPSQLLKTGTLSLISFLLLDPLIHAGETDPSAARLEASPAPTPAPAPSPTSTPLVPTSDKFEVKRDPRVPLFYDVKPQWGLQLGFSPNEFGGVALTKAQGTLPAYGFALTYEFQPKFLQFFGVLGFGPTLSVYPIFGGTNLTPTFAAIWSAGGQVRYQAKYFRQQILVPMVGYAYEYFSYQFSSGPTGSFKPKGPIYGLWLLLNKLDMNAATDFYIDAGVARTYLIFEAHTLKGGDANLSIGGMAYYTGLRIEY